MRKSSEIRFKTQRGSEVVIEVVRNQGIETVDTNLDGDILSEDKYIENSYVFVTIESLNVNRFMVDAPYFYEKHNCYVINLGKGRLVAIPEEVYNEIIRLSEEKIDVAESVEKEEVSEIEVKKEYVKKMIEEGKVLPKKDLESKKIKYDIDFNEGGEGYNPYNEYITKEYAGYILSKTV